MKILIALLLAATMLLSLAACGGAAEPAAPTESAATTPAATEPAAQVTEPPAPEPTAAPTEPPIVYTPYELGESESYLDVVRELGFTEVDLEACVADAASAGAAGAGATPISLALSENGFRMEVDYTGFDFFSNQIVHYGTVEIIGAKAEGIADISGINRSDYARASNATYEGQGGIGADYLYTGGGYLLQDYHRYYNEDASGAACDIANVLLSYYVSSGNLYNIIYHAASDAEDPSEPCLLTRIFSSGQYAPFQPEVRTMTWGDYTFEMSQFAIQCGEFRYVYDYRPGMSLSDWACSELNTDGWIPWHGDVVLSPDRTFSCTTGYLDMREEMDFLGHGNLLIAQEYGGNINHISNDGTVVDFELPPNATVIGSATVGSEGLTDEALKEILEQYGLDPNTPVKIIGNPGEMPMDQNAIINGMGSEENELQEKGNISTPVAHMVNAKTPLCTPGFRIVSKEDGLAAYHSVGMGDGFYLLDDVLDIYMNGIAEELIPHIKLYAFPESEAFLATLEDRTILNAHPTPLEQGNEMLTIPENAVCLSFQRVNDGEEAPNGPTTRKPGHENLNKDAVYARYVTKDDPNFSEGVNLVFAITFDDELVYWIHMGANFHETVNTERLVDALPY